MTAIYVSRRAAKRSTREAECIAPRAGATGVGGSVGDRSRATPFSRTLARRGRTDASNSSSDGLIKLFTALMESGSAADPRPAAWILKRSFLSAVSRAARTGQYNGAHDLRSTTPTEILPHHPDELDL